MSEDISDRFETALRGIVGLTVIGEAPMSEYTTFKIGGPAQWLVEPSCEEAVCAAVDLCAAEGVPLRVIGSGSNLLIADEGLRGVVMRMGRDFAAVEVDPETETLRALAGATNEAVARAACEAGLAGYEFAAGIPGTVGGAAVMNAGAYGGEFKDVAVEVRCVDRDGKVLCIDADDARWGYRRSRMMDDGLTVLSATLKLAPDDPGAIAERMEDLRRRREEKQPLETPSAGSTFKRPEGYYAGKLIQDAGMQGFSVGGAQVSTKHAGFVVNTGDATAEDVLDLIEEVRKAVFERFGVEMEPEVRLWHS